MSPTTIPKPASYASNARWQIKIFDGEPGYEDPHVTVLFKHKPRPKMWRVNLKTLQVMDANPPKRELPQEIFNHIRDTIDTIRAEWNKKYPGNRVALSDEENEEAGDNSI